MQRQQCKLNHKHKRAKKINLDHVFVLFLHLIHFHNETRILFFPFLVFVFALCTAKISGARVLIGCMCVFFSMVYYPQGVEQLIDALDSGTL